MFVEARRRTAASGPDAVVPGWFYNLGITGLRVELVADAPTHLGVRYVFVCWRSPPTAGTLLRTAAASRRRAARS